MSNLEVPTGRVRRLALVAGTVAVISLVAAACGGGGGTAAASTSSNKQHRPRPLGPARRRPGWKPPGPLAAALARAVRQLRSSRPCPG